ncbi:MAG TPA: hypothetical protein PK829_07610 [Promineifilum sp.]|nr:hypothetical protein [Promineifilum sp.]
MSISRWFGLAALMALGAALLLLGGCSAGAALPPVLFLRVDDAGRAQLYRQDASGGAARRLSAHPAGDVLDFAAAPDGSHVVYSVLDGSEGALRLVDADGGGDRELLACPAAECSAPVWSPDGKRLIYEHRPLSASGVLGSPRLMWLDPASGETIPLVATEVIGYGARFSPDGAWLSYVSPEDEGVVLVPLAGGAQRLLSSRVGRPAAFSPDASQIVISDITLVAEAAQESSRVYLYRVSLAEEGRERLSPAQPVDDSAPAWSPDGQWIAFGRAPADTAAGRQLWLMRSDGSDARALTAEPAIFHGPPTWSPDGRALLYQRYDLNDPAATPQVWSLRPSDGAQTLIAPGGYLPAWLPGG